MRIEHKGDALDFAVRYIEGSGPDTLFEVELSTMRAGQAFTREENVGADPWYRIKFQGHGEQEFRDLADGLRAASEHIDRELAAGFGKHIAKPAPPAPTWLERHLRQ